jgi:hypothetical protein
MTESAQKQSQVHKNAQIDNKKRIKVFDDRGTKAWADTPDDWVDELRGGIESCTKVGTNSGVLHKEWVGLTNEEIADVWKTEYFNISYELPRAIEAKLKGKNT